MATSKITEMAAENEVAVSEAYNALALVSHAETIEQKNTGLRYSWDDRRSAEKKERWKRERCGTWRVK